MQIDIGELIGDLLYENSTVSIPGLGAFVKSVEQASVDKVQDKAQPEKSTIEFNENLAIDDGLLIAYLKDKFKLSYQEAKQTIAAFVQEVKEALEKKEIIVFPGVGRLYNDFEKKLQFIPDNKNFHLPSFGLPEVNISPAPLPEQTPIAAVAASPEKNKSAWTQRNEPILVGLLGLLLVLIFFLFFYPKFFKNQEADPTADLPSSRLNVKPPPVSPKDSAMAELENDTNTENISEGEESTADEEALEEEDVPSESSTIAPDTKVCVIAVGIFRNKENVDRLSKRILDAGMEPYIEKIGSKTRVGVQFAYNKELDISRTLEKVRNQFEPNAFVMKR